MAGTPASSAEVRPLAALAPAAGAAFGIVLLALLVADVAPAVRVVLLVAFAIAAFGAARHLQTASRPHRVDWDGEGRWWFDGRPVAIAPSTRVHGGLIVLVLREPAGGRHRRSVHWVPRAAASPVAFRRLKTRLRLGPGPAGKAPSDTPC